MSYIKLSLLPCAHDESAKHTLTAETFLERIVSLTILCMVADLHHKVWMDAFTASIFVSVPLSSCSTFIVASILNKDVMDAFSTNSESFYVRKRTMNISY